MNVGEIKTFDVANGTGIRVTVFVSGCTNHCKGCFQPQTWDFKYGEPYTKEMEDFILEELKKTTDEYKEYSLILQKSAENSRSPAVAELSRAQLEYSWKMEQLLKGELEKEMHSEGNSLPEDKAEAITLYSEYALDLASQAMRYALIASLSAMDLQLKAEEQKN